MKEKELFFVLYGIILPGISWFFISGIKRTTEITYIIFRSFCYVNFSATHYPPPPAG